MRDRSPTLHAMAALVLLLAPAGGTAHADTVAEIENTGAKLLFRPVVKAETLTLSVSGPCDYRYRTSGREEPVFALGEETMDGRYSFSLVAATPVDAEIKELLREARAAGDNSKIAELCRAGRLPKPTSTQTGTFAVVQGKIVFDATPESTRRSDNDEGAPAKPEAEADEEATPALAAGAPAELAPSMARAPAKQPASDCAWASWSGEADGRDLASDGR